jgi:hypothetical protein
LTQSWQGIHSAIRAVKWFDKKFNGYMTIDAKFSQQFEYYLTRNLILSSDEIAKLKPSVFSSSVSETRNHKASTYPPHQPNNPYNPNYYHNNHLPRPPRPSSYHSQFMTDMNMTMNMSMNPPNHHRYGNRSGQNHHYRSNNPYPQHQHQHHAANHMNHLYQDSSQSSHVSLTTPQPNSVEHHSYLQYAYQLQAQRRHQTDPFLPATRSSSSNTSSLFSKNETSHELENDEIQPFNSVDHSLSSNFGQNEEFFY